ncbi:mediator of RNA polymerase II transcription subunit 29 isoform X1 [Gymnodraco acuticeps]|uniref:Mediator of RNA polymerase II transcription subunit 29 n=1 Tax=Gymnodraco acuticeps TaxID=8218 RepID=A0A6P8W1E9_GYMAC|nr:mediator of RNA polymerase II transcription subunit 29 isoform X1 [Gymnodraco acuticeps]
MASQQQQQQPGGPMSQPGGPMSQPGGPMSQPGGAMSQSGGPMSQSGGPMSQSGGPMSQSGGPMSQSGGPMSQPGLQQQASLQQQQQQLLSQQQDFDPVHRFKMLIPQLKESLQNVMKIASLNLAHNTTIDNGIKSSDTTVQRFDKSLEEFYALCDQLELCLRLAYECLSQSIDSAKHSPNLVPTATKPDTVQTESMSYSQYLGMIKSQISCAKDIHNALLECSKKIAGKGQPQGIM